MKTILKSVFLVFALVLISQPEAIAKKKEVKEITIQSDFTCGGCKAKIEHNIKFEKGVTAISADLKTMTITISYRTDKTNPEKLREAISKLGYKADDVKPKGKKDC